jgi:hypothetical protein
LIIIETKITAVRVDVGRGSLEEASRTLFLPAIPVCVNPEATVKLRRKLFPGRIRVFRTSQGIADALVHGSLTLWIGQIVALLRPAFSARCASNLNENGQTSGDALQAAIAVVPAVGWFGGCRGSQWHYRSHF